jgi:crotonobetainyl-CoA:carnitine CoA-transferase CaiB-like acyl-CoA transferase
MIQGMGGLMSLTGEPDGMPTKVGVAFADIFTGMYASNAVLAALMHRERTGEGQFIDMALLDVQVAVLANQAMNYLASGTPPRRMGNAHPNIVPYQAFATSDGHIIIAVGNDAQFARFCRVAGRPDLAEDEGYRTNKARVANRAVLVPILEEIVGARPSAQWLADLETEGVPCGPINTLDQVFADPQVVHRGMKVTVPHSAAGSVDLVANPIRFSETPVSYDRAPPTLGQDTDDVLNDLLGLDPQARAALRDEGVI